MPSAFSTAVFASKTKVTYTYLPQALPLYAKAPGYEYAEKYGVDVTNTMNKEIIKVTGLEAGKYTIKMDGKTVAEVLEMPTYERDASHTACPDVEELKASCTITVGDYLKAFAEATK